MKRWFRRRSAGCAAAAVLVFCAAVWVCAANPAVAQAGLSYAGYGGQGTVSGSLHVIDVDGDLYLIDAGLFMGESGANHPWPEEIPVSSIAAVFITHAHADHIGRLPLLLHEGYRGPLYMTEATRDIAMLTLPGNIHRTDFGVERFYYSRHNEGKSRIPVYLDGYGPGDGAVQERNRVFFEARRTDLEKGGYYLVQRRELREDLLRRLTEQTRIIHPGGRDALGPVEFEFIHTSHLPGSVMIALSVAGRELLFSGDLGSDGSPLFDATAALERRIDFLWLEGTYDSPRNLDYALLRREFRLKVGDLIGRGFRVVIPAFAVDRSQQVLFELSRAIEEGVLPEQTPVKVFSRSANDITALYRAYAQDRRLADGYFSDAVTPRSFSLPGYSEPPVDWSSDDPLRLGHGEIGIMTSGMAEHAFARRAVEEYGTDGRTAFVFVSYQARGTPGRQMLDGAETVVFSDGARAGAGALVYQSNAFNGHADPGQILRIFGASTIGEVFLVHLNTSNADRLTGYYRENLGVPVSVPPFGERIRLGMGTPKNPDIP